MKYYKITDKQGEFTGTFKAESPDAALVAALHSGGVSLSMLAEIDAAVFDGTIEEVAAPDANGIRTVGAN